LAVTGTNATLTGSGFAGFAIISQSQDTFLDDWVLSSQGLAWPQYPKSINVIGLPFQYYPVNEY
jgi:hypothetical protein